LQNQALDPTNAVSDRVYRRRGPGICPGTRPGSNAFRYIVRPNRNLAFSEFPMYPLLPNALRSHFLELIPGFPALWLVYAPKRIVASL
jgi:hypothetical protein